MSGSLFISYYFAFVKKNPCYNNASAAGVMAKIIVDAFWNLRIKIFFSCFIDRAPFAI